jgi:hypothetical protein
VLKSRYAVRYAPANTVSEANSHMRLTSLRVLALSICLLAALIAANLVYSALDGRSNTLTGSAGELLYTAAFSGFADEWDLYAGQQSAHIVDEQLELSVSAPQTAAWSAARPQFADFDMRVQAVASEGPLDNAFGLVFHIRNDEPADCDMPAVLLCGVEDLLPLAGADDEWRWAVDGLRAAGEYAAERGVSVALECWTRFETYFLNRLEQAVELWEAIGLSNGGVMGDTFHMNIEEASLADAIRHAGPHLAHMHLADSNRLPPGYGHTDFREVLRALHEVDYTGWLAFELLPDTADPFTVFRAGGHADFFDRYTRDAITHMRRLEAELGVGD